MSTAVGTALRARADDAMQETDGVPRRADDAPPEAPGAHPKPDDASPEADGPSPEADDARPEDKGPQPRAGDPRITEELFSDHGLSPGEADLIREGLGREPTYTELGVFSAMWSEHCGYKNSKPLLRTYPTDGPTVIQGPGENAGVVDVGDGYAVAFKIESHNHPSAVEPYQGAATGVGGILRDVFTMGARPVAVLDSLHFGDLERPEVKYLFDGVVRGIGDYGNCVGIPNIGGEVWFGEGWEGNPIVNAMCVGVLRKEELITAVAAGEGSPLMAVGARTGRDGIHGATFASVELSADDDSASRPRVQVGDPFKEKLLLEASLEMIASGAISGIQDMGAAGITSSASEMAGRGGSGVEIDTALVPVRESGMTPYEILLSESQERMLVVVLPGREDEVRTILDKWELEAATIGRVTSDGRFRVLEAGTCVCDVPADLLVEGCPTYERPAVEDEEVRARRDAQLASYIEAGLSRVAQGRVGREATASPSSVPGAASGRVAGSSSAPAGKHYPLDELLLTVLSSPNVASKHWVHRQYDSTVQASTVLGPGSDAGVVRIRGESRGIAATVDCNARHVYLEPREGARGAVAEAARNLACAGAKPLAITNNLNFGSPLKPGVYFQMREAVQGIGEACRAFGTPVTGGNVSLYNETDGVPIYPTPVVGMIGVVESCEMVLGAAFRVEGDDIILLGETRDELGGSEFLYRTAGVVVGPPPRVDLEAEKRLQGLLLALNAQGRLRSAHDCSLGGISCTLAECALGDLPGSDGFGIEVVLTEALDPIPLLFSESHGRVVISCPPEETERILAGAAEADVRATRIGSVGRPGSDFSVTLVHARRHLSCAARSLAMAYLESIPSIMGTP